MDMCDDNFIKCMNAMAIQHSNGRVGVAVPCLSIFMDRVALTLDFGPLI